MNNKNLIKYIPLILIVLSIVLITSVAILLLRGGDDNTATINDPFFETERPHGPPIVHYETTETGEVIEIITIE